MLVKLLLQNLWNNCYHRFRPFLREPNSTQYWSGHHSHLLPIHGNRLQAKTLLCQGSTYIHIWSQPVHKCGREEGFSHHLPMVQTLDHSIKLTPGNQLYQHLLFDSYHWVSWEPSHVPNVSTKDEDKEKKNRHLSATKTGLYLSSMFMKNAKRNRTNTNHTHTRTCPFQAWWRWPHSDKGWGTKGSKTLAAKEQCCPVHWWLTGLGLHWKKLPCKHMTRHRTGNSSKWTLQSNCLLMTNLKTATRNLSQEGWVGGRRRGLCHPRTIIHRPDFCPLTDKQPFAPRLKHYVLSWDMCP